MAHAPDEKWLVQQVLSGDRKAFEQLVRTYEALVLHIVNPLIGLRPDREDICQDIFVKVYENLHRFEFRSKLSTWIGAIAYNSCIHFLQKRKNTLPGDLHLADEASRREFEISTGSPEDLFIRKQEARHLQVAIDQLPALQKTALLLFHHDDLSLEEMAQVLGMPVNTAKSHLFRARKTLKSILSKTAAL